MTDNFCGNCVFYLSKCPECGSTDIEVGIIYDGNVFTYQNDTEDEIAINYKSDSLDDCDICDPFFIDEEDEEDAIGIQCNKCGCESNSMITSDQFNKPSITKLLNQIVNMLQYYDNPTYLFSHYNAFRGGLR